jgi:ribosomal-protein-serine acetyltransferase
MIKITISSDLELRQLQEADAGAAYQLADKNRALLREWLGWLDKTNSAADYLVYIRDQALWIEAGKGAVLGIFFQGNFAGMVGLNTIDKVNKRAEIGYWLGAEYQGKGIMTAAVKAIMETGFKDYDLNKLELHAATGNARSRAVAERLDFQLDGVLRQHEWLYDHFVDHASYSLLRADWQKN